jgi:tRNA pseudouridine55 synthase
MLADKPLGLTSADVVYRFKRYLNLDKIGHAGTLDPRATGLLILCSDKMTKRISEFMDSEKEYSGVIKIGATTKTFDTESEEENYSDTSKISDEDIIKVKDTFIGEIEQIPPMHSAIKLNGKPIYKLARKGKTIDLKPRRVFLKSFEVSRININEISFDVVCSKGTYIRSLANDFGAKLGVGGYLKSLRRTRIGEFTLDNFDEEIKEIKFRIL